MRSRFETYLNTLNKRKEQLENKIKLPPPPNNSFFQDYRYKEPKLNKLNALIEHIRDYEQNTNEIAEKYSENNTFYQEHLHGVEKLLERIENKYLNSEEFEEDDFKFIFTSSKPYEITDSDRSKTIGNCVSEGMQLGACIGIVTGLLVGAALGITSMVFFGLPGLYITIGLLFIGVMMGYIAGGLIGTLAGVGVGLWQASSSVPTDNNYINNSAFDFSLLKAAYQETVQIVGNDERNEEKVIKSLD